MSVDATRWAWQNGNNPRQKLVLLALADRANEAGICFPSTKRLEADTMMDRKTIFKVIKELEQHGLLTVERDQGKGNIYRLIGVPHREDSHSSATTKTSAKKGTSHKNGTSAKNGTTPVPKTVPDQYQKRDTEPKKNLKTNLTKEKIPKRKPTTISFENLPTGISVEAAEAFIDYRKTMKKPLTQRAFDLNMAIAAKAGSIGITPDQAIDMTILAVWQGINLKWIADRMKKNEAHQHSGKQYKTKPKFDPNEMLDRQQAAIMGSGCSSHSYSGFPENDGDLRSSMDEKSYDSECIELSPSGMGEWS